MYCNAVSQVTLLYLAGQEPLVEDRHYQVRRGQDRDHRDTGLQVHSNLALQHTHTDTRTELSQRSFPVAAPTVWNSLPAHLRSTLIGRRKFRDGLKSHLFADAYFWLGLDRYHAGPSIPDTIGRSYTNTDAGNDVTHSVQHTYVTYVCFKT